MSILIIWVIIGLILALTSKTTLTWGQRELPLWASKIMVIILAPMVLGILAYMYVTGKKELDLNFKQKIDEDRDELLKS